MDTNISENISQYGKTTLKEKNLKYLNQQLCYFIMPIRTCIV